MVQILDTGSYAWGPAAYIRQWIPRVLWMEWRGRLNVELIAKTPVAGATDEEEAGARATDEGASAAGATGDRRFRQEILQWSLDTVARHQFRKRQDGGKMEQAVQASRRRLHVRRMEEWTASMGTTIPPPTETVARINGVG